MDVWGLAPGMPPGRQQAHLRVGPRPKAQPVEPAIRFSVLFQPDKAHGLIAKAPRLDKPQGLRELGERGPQKKNAVRGRQFRHGQRAQFLNPHRGVVPLRRTLQALLGVPPRRVGVYHGILTDSHTPFPPAATAARACMMRSVAGPKKAGAVSKQINSRPVLTAATAVVPEPAQMSATTSPGAV